MNKNDWAKIRTSIESGIYKMVRLVRIDEKGVSDVIAPYNKKVGKEALERFDYIQMKCSTLPPGNYEVHCKIGANSNSICDKFKLTIKDRRMITIPVVDANGVEDKTKEQITMEQIDLQDHIDLIKKCAQLEANEGVLKGEVEFYKKQMEMLQTQLTNKSLSDGEGESKSGLAKVLEDTAPAIVNSLDKFLDILDKRENNKSKQLSDNKVKKIGMAKKQSIEDIANDYADLLEPLMESDPDKFNEQLDVLEQEQPDVYDIVCELLELEDEEGGEGDAD